ncbi:hypothetical protein ZWY2020_034498 [Hordeum vulgare]|nr:hypothetical protein ZWY2020_034498 [Hordeum vulgare]
MPERRSSRPEGGRRAYSMAPAAMIPSNVENSTWSALNTSTCVPDDSTKAPRAEDGAMGPVGMIVSRIRGGVNSLTRTPGMSSLRRTVGVITHMRGNDAVSLVRLALGRRGYPCCLRHPGGGMKIGRTTRLGVLGGQGVGLHPGRRLDPILRSHLKKFAREVNSAIPRPEAMRPLNWSRTTIAFDPRDQLSCSFMASKLPMMCTSTISNVLVTKTLIDSGAGLNVLSAETFEKLQLPYEQLMPTKPFSGVTEGSTMPIGQVHLPVTFGERKIYHTEIIVFDIAHVHVPYNAILG